MTAGFNYGATSNLTIFNVPTTADVNNSDFVQLSVSFPFTTFSFGIGISGDGKNNSSFSVGRGLGVGASFALPRVGTENPFKEYKGLTEHIKKKFNIKEGQEFSREQIMEIVAEAKKYMKLNKNK